MKFFINKTTTSRIILIIFALTILGSVGISFAQNSGDILAPLKNMLTSEDDKDENIKSKIPAKKTAIMEKTDFSNVNKPAEDEDVSEELLQNIKNKDGKNQGKHTKNLKLLVGRTKMSKRHQEKMSSIIDEGYLSSDVFIAHDLLSECYATNSELKEFINKKGNRDWADVYEEYINSKPKFIPKNFDESELNKLLSYHGINPDDVMIADKLSQLGYSDFDTLFNQRIKGRTWDEISADLDLINVKPHLTNVTITTDEIERAEKKTGMPKEKVRSLIVAAYKAGKDYNEVLSAKKNKNREAGYVYAQLIEDLYK